MHHIRPSMQGHIRKRSGPAGVSYQVIVPTSATRSPVACAKSPQRPRTKREAEEMLSRMLSEVHGGQHGGPDVAMSELFERWYELASPDWSPKTAPRDTALPRQLPHPTPRQGEGTQGDDGVLGRALHEAAPMWRARGAPLSASSVRRIHVAVRARLRRRSDGVGSCTIPRLTRRRES